MWEVVSKLSLVVTQSQMYGVLCENQAHQQSSVIFTMFAQSAGAVEYTDCTSAEG